MRNRIKVSLSSLNALLSVLLVGCLLINFRLHLMKDLSPTDDHDLLRNHKSSFLQAPIAPSHHQSKGNTTTRETVYKFVNLESMNNNDNNNTVAIAISITACGADPITEGAAVLHHSVRMSFSNSSFNYQMVAFVHPLATSCGLELKDLGYRILLCDTPVNVSDIKGDFLRERIPKNGCCGEKELVKLHSLTLIQYPIVVHMDLDSVMLKPMDDLFHLMLLSSSSSSSFNNNNNSIELNDYLTTHENSIEIMWKERPLPPLPIELAYTHDYNLVPAARKYKPIQGGLLIFRPSLSTFQTLVNIVKEGNYNNVTGWGGVVRPFYGGMTVQGLLAYYYNYLQGGNNSLELNRCVYNQMSDNPKMGKTVGEVTRGKCRTRQKKCEDCRTRPLEDIITAHFTVCQKPWWCQKADLGTLNLRLCRKLHHAWFQIRSDLEVSWGRHAMGRHNFDRHHFMGFCSGRGRRNYHAIEKPYGTITPL